jgi:hypothetical protein
MDDEPLPFFESKAVNAPIEAVGFQASFQAQFIRRALFVKSCEFPRKFKLQAVSQVEIGLAQEDVFHCKISTRGTKSPGGGGMR